jgi:predicted transcriptional regulator
MTKGYMTIRIESPLKQRVMEIAKAERRRFSDQVIFLMEKGLLALELAYEDGLPGKKP